MLLLSFTTDAAAAAAPVVLDVPFLAQTPDLCGGAAAAMLLRFWGEPATPAEFAPLLDARARGIPTSALVEAVRARGFQALPFHADPEAVRQQLGRGRPVLGLIGVGGGRLHYVVIVAWLGDRVLLHDPARAPFRVYQQGALLAAWRASGNWALVVSRAGQAGRALEPAGAPDAESSRAAGSPCSGLVAVGVSLAKEGQEEPAEARLRAATELCPGSHEAWRELAGLRFRAERWGEAASLAERAARLAPEDAHSWRLLAASRYLAGDPDGALPAFNRAGDPGLDLLRVDGLTRTRFAALERAVGVERTELLTPRGLERARRRLQDVPALRASRVSYRPGAGGSADLEVAVVERPLLPRGAHDIARLVARAGNERELELLLSSPSGAGELLSASWRFYPARPAFALAAAAPGPFGGAPLHASLRWDEQSYAVGEGLVRERRRELDLFVSDWSRLGPKWELGGSLQRSAERPSLLGPTGALEWRVGERLAVRAEATALFALRAGESSFTRFSAGAAWRSRQEEASPLRLHAGYSACSPRAPRACWPGAGTGAGRPLLLRAHPLLDDGVVSGEAFGRRLAHGGLELEPAGFSIGLLRIAPALFADAARATARDAPGPAAHVDAGVGLRLRLPGGGALRIDVARGLRDGRHAVSAGWSSAWPAWPLR